MEDWRVYLILLTSLTAFIGVLTSRALNRADDQRRVAARLRAYLLYWQQQALDLNVWPILAEGEEWYDEDQKVKAGREPARAKAEKSVALRKKYQDEQAADLSESLGTHGKLADDVKAGIAKMQELAAHSLYEKAVEHAYQLRKELIEGRTFITDTDAAVLDPATVARVVELRMTAASVMDTLAGLLQIVAVKDEEFLRTSAQKQIIDAVLATIRAGYAMKYLIARCDFYLTTSRYQAIKRNFLG